MRACPEIAVATGFAVRPLQSMFTAALAFSSRIEGQFSLECLRLGETSIALLAEDGGARQARVRGVILRPASAS